MHAGTVRIYRHNRRAFHFAAAANRLANHQAPPIETRMFPGRCEVAFDAGEEHFVKSLKR